QTNTLPRQSAQRLLPPRLLRSLRFFSGSLHGCSLGGVLHVSAIRGRRNWGIILCGCSIATTRIFDLLSGLFSSALRALSGTRISGTANGNNQPTQCSTDERTGRTQRGQQHSRCHGAQRRARCSQPVDLKTFRFAHYTYYPILAT